MFRFTDDTTAPDVEFTVSNRTILRVIVAAILAIVFFAAMRHSATHADADWRGVCS
jgi:hypothetical protein